MALNNSACKDLRPAPALTMSAQPVPAPQRPTQPSPLRVLVIEDSLDDFEELQRLFSKSEEIDALLTWVQTLSPALSLLEAQPFDLILSDLRLPDARDIDLLKTLHGSAKTIPIVILTGSTDEKLALQLLRAGAQDFLTKGNISSADLIRSIRFSIERQRMITELQHARAEIERLAGLLPICASCKKVRDDRGYWSSVESYIQQHIGTQITHGLCPECIPIYFKAAAVSAPAF